MLNIPESVKVLFKQDGARKNFRAHFLNGEMPDITNTDIVQESVRFTESLCSQDNLKFGLTEASVIEFETVGVGNIYGLMMECSCEIDLSGLSAAELEEIEAGEWDGVYVPASESDIGYAFFRVPYGVFRVESCPRNFETLARRQVTAYTLEGRKELENPFETAKAAMLLPGLENYTPNAKLLALSVLGFQSPKTLKNLGYQTEELTDYHSKIGDFQISYEFSFPLVRESGEPVTVYFFLIYEYLDDNRFFPPTTPEGSSYRPSEILYAVETHQEIYAKKIKAAAVEVLTAEQISLEKSEIKSVDELLAPLLEVASPNIEFTSYFTEDTAYYAHFGRVLFEKSNYALYFGTDNIGVKFERPLILSAAVYADADNTEGLDYFETYSNLWSVEKPAQIFKWIPPENEFSSEDLNLMFKSTGKGKTVNALTGYSFIDAYSQHDIAVGFLELQGLFAAPSRHGGYAVKRLETSGAMNLIPSDYSALWWDEFNVEPIGKILFSFTDEENESQEQEYKFSEDPSVYDLRSNALLTNVHSTTAEKIQALIDKYFIPNLGQVHFTPIDMSLKGLPYTETGDAVSALAEDGTVVESYNMTYTQTGIQALQAAMTSVSGQILDSEGDLE